MKQLVLTEIWIYPVKSLGGIKLQASKILEKGLQHDRRWMLIDQNNKFMTQRVHPEMALFKLSINADSITITYVKNGSEVEHPSVVINTLKPAIGKMCRASVWDDHVDTIEVDPRISVWFSDKLGIECKLVSFPEQNPRTVDPRYAVVDQNVSLADAFPFLVIGQSSLDDLNGRLNEELPMNRFRPNFVFSGGDPFEEDSWRDFSIGKNRFVGVKPCARCILPNVDQDTAEQGKEPLAMLSTYRKRDNKVYFGQNLIALDQGVVSVGDIITLNP